MVVLLAASGVEYLVGKDAVASIATLIVLLFIVAMVEDMGSAMGAVIRLRRKP